MSKIFTLFFITFLIFSNINNIFADDKIRIYTRSEWGANENYRYINSTYWKNILKNREINNKIWQKKWAKYSQTTKNSIIKKNKIKSERRNKQNNYLSKNFSKDIKLVEYKKYDGKNKLAWPIGKTEFVKNIVIHHTESEYKNSWEGIKKIQRYHSINRQWGDIGYNFIIGYNGEIFEGRAGGNYAVGAHDTWNNRSTVGISIMGNYQKKEINSAQYQSLKKLISYLTKKYGIDLNEKIPYHRECYGKDCTSGLKTNYFFPIVGHRDGKNTACPGETNYNKVIPKLIKELQPETKGYKNISYLNIIKQKEEYKNKINTQYNWKNIKIRFNKLSEKTKKRILFKLKTFTQYKYFDWKKELLYKKLYEELKN